MILSKKLGATLLFSMLLSAALASGATAAGKSKVGKITLTFDTDIRTGSSGGEVYVSASGSNTDAYYVDSVEVINDEGDNWTRSNPPEVEIVLGVEDEEEYYFGSESAGSFKLNLSSSIKNRYDKVDFVKADRQDNNGALILTVRLVFDKDADISRAAAPSGVKWTDANDATGSWNDVSTAKYYQVQLLKDSTTVSSIESVYENTYRFAHLITEPGTYRFKVRSVTSSNNAKSSWITSGSWTVSAEQAAILGNTPLALAVSNGSTGSWERAADGIRWWWKNPDGSYPAAAWLETDGNWYYFDKQGYMQTGWIEIHGVFYYLDTGTGAMYASRRTPDGFWVDESGAWVPGM